MMRAYVPGLLALAAGFGLWRQAATDRTSTQAVGGATQLAAPAPKPSTESPSPLRPRATSSLPPTRSTPRPEVGRPSRSRTTEETIAAQASSERLEEEWSQEPFASQARQARIEPLLLAQFGLEAKAVVDVDCRVSLCRLDFVIPAAPSDPSAFGDMTAPDNPHPENDVATMFYPIASLTDANNEEDDETD